MSDLMEKLKLEWITEGIEEGRAKGKMEGKLEGETSKAASIAHGMKKKGFDIDLIMELTGLSKDKILML